jgi:N-methylhydantoinase A
VPARPGITNAIGCVVADLRHDFVQTVNRPVDALDDGQLSTIFAAQVAEGERLIGKESVDVRDIRRLYSVDMQFAGQTHLLRVELDRPDISGSELRALFEAAYFKRFRVELAEIRAMVVNANCSVIGERAPLDLSTLIAPSGRKASVAEAQTGTRRVRFDGTWHETPVYWRDHLPAEAVIDGPAIVEQMDTTLLIGPGDRAEGDAHGNLILHVGATT